MEVKEEMVKYNIKYKWLTPEEVKKIQENEEIQKQRRRNSNITFRYYQKKFYAILDKFNSIE